VSGLAPAELDRAGTDRAPVKLRGGEIEYTIEFPDGQAHRFVVDLEREPEPPPDGATLPAWTELEYHKCPNCPLQPGDREHCPPAVDSLRILGSFQDAISHSTCRARVRTPEREYVKDCDVQTVLRSLLGLVMATSGCPPLSKLRGMATHHLPFATVQETVYRTTANYLLRQFFVHRSGGQADLDLVELRSLYRELQVVNESFLKRIRVATRQDASLNALLNLLSVATLVEFSLDEGLRELEKSL
jgi:hypothetical protein